MLLQLQQLQEQTLTPHKCSHSEIHIAMPIAGQTITGFRAHPGEKKVKIIKTAGNVQTDTRRKHLWDLKKVLT